jgi:hypothetical protein
MTTLKPVIYLSLVSIMVINFTGCGNDDDTSDSLIDKLTLSEESIDVTESLSNVTFERGNSLNLTVGVGSGAFHFSEDPSDEFYTVTDRGPNIDCDDVDTIGIADFCKNAAGVVDENGKVFPNPDFTPTIYKFNIDTSGALGIKTSYEVKETIPLRDRDNNPITGLPNPLVVMTTEAGYDNEGQLLAFDPEGVDTEAVIKLANGTFWLAEEYAPSLIHTAANGRILERVVPEGVAANLADANYTISGNLPGILKKRQLNRGIESLAVSPDEQYLYFMMQSPLANPTVEAYQNSRYVRLFKVSLLSGNMDEVIGEYIYELDLPEAFTADNSTKQNDVKVSEMVALALDELIILERITRHTKLYRVNLNDATNILGTQWDSEIAPPPSLEELTNLTAQGITPLTKTLVFNSPNDASDLAFKIESIALLSNEYAVLINDNDFNIQDTQTIIRVLKIVDQLKQ